MSKHERVRLWASLAIFILSAGALGYAFWSSHTIRIPRLGGTYIEGFVGSPRYINPLYGVGSDVDRDLTRLVFRGLTNRHGTQYVLDLATAIEEESGTRSKITISPEAKFHNGEPVTSTDVLFTIESVKNPAFGSPLAATYTDVNVEPIDDTTFTLTYPEKTDVWSLLSIGILPSSVWETVSPDAALLSALNLRPVGNGPYQVTKLTRNEDGAMLSLTLKAFPDYPGDGPYLSTLVIKFYPTAASAADALRSGAIDGAATLPVADAVALSDAPGMETAALPLPQFVGIFFNTKITPFTDEAVRNALALAVDRAAIARTARGAFATPILSPGIPNFTSADTRAIPPADAGAAAAALDAAGWTVGADNVRQKDGATLAITLTVLDEPSLQTAAETVAAAWRTLNITVDVQSIDRTTLTQGLLKDRSFTALLADGQYMSMPADPYIFWHSSQSPYPGLNISQWSDSTADQAVVTIRKQESDDSVKAAYTALTDALLAHTPAILLYEPLYPYLTRKDIFGTESTPIFSPADRLSQVQQWYLKTRTVRKTN